MNVSYLDLWRPTKVAPDQAVCRRIGPLTLWLRKTADEWRVATERVPEAETPTAPAPEPREPADGAWRRWAAGEEAGLFRLYPVMPDRPLVARAESALTIPPNRHAHLIMSIPLWVRVTVGAEFRSVLGEEPTVPLGSTWFGDPTSGEMCYSLLTHVRRSYAEAEPRDHRVVCPVLVNNGSTDPLEFDKLCIHVAHLSVYTTATQLWTNEIRVTFRGRNQPSEVDYSKDVPAIEPVTGILSEPRVPLVRGLLHRSFASLLAFREP